MLRYLFVTTTFLVMSGPNGLAFPAVDYPTDFNGKRMMLILIITTIIIIIIIIITIIIIIIII